MSQEQILIGYKI